MNNIIVAVFRALTRAIASQVKSTLIDVPYALGAHVSDAVTFLRNDIQLSEVNILIPVVTTIQPDYNWITRLNCLQRQTCNDRISDNQFH